MWSLLEVSNLISFHLDILSVDLYMFNELFEKTPKRVSTLLGEFQFDAFLTLVFSGYPHNILVTFCGLIFLRFNNCVNLVQEKLKVTKYRIIIILILLQNCYSILRYPSIRLLNLGMRPNFSLQNPL